MPVPRNIRSTFECLAGLNVNISDLILCLMLSSQEQLNILEIGALNDLSNNYYVILNTFKAHTIFSEATRQWIHQNAAHDVLGELRQLTSKSTGWHGNARNATVSQLQSIDSGSLAQTARNVSPCLWTLFENLLSEVVDSDLEGDETSDNLGQESGSSAHTRPLSEDRIVRLREIRIISFIATIARLRNQKCNAFASNMGLFLHASGASQRVIHTMSQIGLSTSLASINRTVDSLSREAYKSIRAAGQSLHYMMVYDNLVIDFGSPGQSVVEKSNRSLWNLTTGTYINHHYNPEDLRCAEEVWKRDPNNDEEDHSTETPTDYYSLLKHISEPLDSEGLSVHQRFFAWILRCIICTYGPLFFRNFQSKVGQPETIEPLPIQKTEQVPVRAMKHDNSTVSGNIDAIHDILDQGGIRRHSPDSAPVSGEPLYLSEYVVMLSGDLGSAERIEAARKRRAIDLCLWETLRYIIFIPGMFHVKMHLLDMLWRLFIKPFASEHDPTSAVGAAKYLCPRAKDTNKLLRGPPTYQQMKRFLKHLGVSERLTCWRTALEEMFGSTIWTDLDDQSYCDTFAQQFTWEDTVAMSKSLVKTYFSLKGIRSRSGRSMEPDMQDCELQNTLYRNYYMLLYDETVHAMNFGDIGLLERCLIDWIPAFRAVGKHKYAYHLTAFFTNVHFKYPGPLKQAARTSMLCNLSGKAGKFQGNDWVEELNNLYTKVVYGGKGSNRTIERVIKESPLIQVYRDVLTSVESFFLLGQRTVKHGEPDMTMTYKDLVTDLYSKGLFKHHPGRKTVKKIMDAFKVGHEKLNEKGGDWDLESDEGSLDSITPCDEDDILDGIDIE